MFGVPDQIPSQPSRIPSQSVRVSGYLGFRVTDPSQSAAALDPLLVRAMIFCPPECFILLAVRCIPLPQGGRATGPSPGAGYRDRAGAGGTRPYPEVGRLAVWVRLSRSAARSASQSYAIQNLFQAVGRN